MRDSSEWVIYTIEALAHANPLWLQKTLGVMGLQLYYHAWGLDASVISQKERPKSKSYSKNQILMRDYDVKAEILMIIKEMVGEVCARRNGRIKFEVSPSSVFVDKIAARNLTGAESSPVRRRFV